MTTKGYWNILKFLYIITYIKASSKQLCKIIQIGFKNILSPIMIAKGLMDTDSDGKLFLLIDQDYKSLKKLIQLSGVDPYIDIVSNRNIILKEEDIIDILYIEHISKGQNYQDLLMLFEPKLKYGSILMAYGIKDPDFRSDGFLENILDADKWVTQFLFMDIGGLSLSVKK
jgi:hypothetical protein